MTHNDKDLLLRDLCARLPYGVKGRVSRRDYNNRECEFVATIDGKLYDRFAVAQESWFDNVTIKPYLFPLSSMTEDQKKEYRKVGELDTEILVKHPMDGSPFPALYNSQDWLDAHHFDYRGLIPMGLANDATGLNIY